MYFHNLKLFFIFNKTVISDCKNSCQIYFPNCVNKGIELEGINLFNENMLVKDDEEENTELRQLVKEYGIDVEDYVEIDDQLHTGDIYEDINQFLWRNK